MASRKRTNNHPVEGDYLTDGKTLYEMTGTDTDGYFYLLDCRNPIGTGTPIKLSPTELTAQGFRIVTR